MIPIRDGVQNDRAPWQVKSSSRAAASLAGRLSESFSLCGTPFRRRRANLCRRFFMVIGRLPENIIEMSV